LSIVFSLFLVLLSVVTLAATLNVYEKPEEHAKIIASMKSGEQLMPIFYTEKRDWVKVANPKNGDVGWVKVGELKGPMIITKINGVETRQQIIADKNSKDQKPQVYSIIQYSGSQELKPEDAQKVVKDMEERSKKMNESMQRMQEHMQKNISEMFKELDRSFYTFPIIQPIIVIPENNDKAKK
jgi:hypothetical protein